jgi:tetratricopeptide (TPR) repeat protein
MDLIERYFNNSLSDKELVLFEEKLASDSLFAKEVQQFGVVLDALKKARVKKLKAQFISYEKEYNSSGKRFNFRNLKRRKATVSLVFWVLLIGFSIQTSLYFSTKSSSNHDELFVNYFEVYPNVISPVKRTINDQNIVLNAMNYYDAENYISAIEAFDKLLLNSDSRNEILFYKALALMTEGDYLTAQTQFELMNIESGVFVNQRNWYLALVFLKLEKHTKAKILLKEVVADSSSFSIKASRLLNELSAS